DRRQGGVQRGDGRAQVVLRRLALRRVGGTEAVDALRKGRGRGNDSALLGLTARVGQQCGKAVLQFSKKTAEVGSRARRAQNAINRLQRRLGGLQAGDRGVLLH